MWCPKCEEDGVEFAGVVFREKEFIKLRLECWKCKRVFYVEVEEEDLKGDD